MYFIGFARFKLSNGLMSNLWVHTAQLLSICRANLEDWIRREIIDDDPWDTVEADPRVDRTHIETTLIQSSTEAQSSENQMIK
jgi:hypothetical protein